MSSASFVVVPPGQRTGRGHRLYGRPRQSWAAEARLPVHAGPVTHTRRRVLLARAQLE
jgi:hypothetical protein